MLKTVVTDLICTVICYIKTIKVNGLNCILAVSKTSSYSSRKDPESLDALLQSLM